MQEFAANGERFAEGTDADARAHTTKILTDGLLETCALKLRSAVEGHLCEECLETQSLDFWAAQLPPNHSVAESCRRMYS